MTTYQNESLNQIARKFPTLDLSGVDDVFVVPVGEICEKLGLKAEFTKLEEGHSGYLDRASQTIFINERYSGSRNLFTVAHEIGHYILHESDKDHRFDQYKKYTSEGLKREWEANQFAGELVMPKYKFEEIFRELQGNLKKIADWFGVSQRAVEVRGFCLGLIDNI